MRSPSAALVVLKMPRPAEAKDPVPLSSFSVPFKGFFEVLSQWENLNLLGHKCLVNLEKLDLF